MKFDFSKIEGFDWDKGSLEHIRKHGVEIKECEEIFFNKPLIINKDEEHSLAEKRFRVYGRIDNSKLIMLIFTIRNARLRVISARNQNKKERSEFQKLGGE